MHHTPTLELTQRVLRASICTRCPGRPPGSEAWGPDTPRPCEHACRLFEKLRPLCETARQCDPMLTDLHAAIARQIHHVKAAAKPSASGAKPIDGLTRQSGKVASILARLFGY